MSQDLESQLKGTQTEGKMIQIDLKNVTIKPSEEYIKKTGMNYWNYNWFNNNDDWNKIDWKKSSN